MTTIFFQNKLFKTSQRRFFATNILSISIKDFEQGLSSIRINYNVLYIGRVIRVCVRACIYAHENFHQVGESHEKQNCHSVIHTL